MNDNQMKVTFTLPIPYGEEADEVAERMAKRMGMENPRIVYSNDVGRGFTFFVLCGKSRENNISVKVPGTESDVMDRIQYSEFIKMKIKREVVMVGASTGTDAHTVGIDAIINQKGFHGHFGLEKFEGINAINYGSQIPNEELIEKAIDNNADAILISQTVTQRDIYILNLTDMVELLESKGIRDKVILICGGPGISHELAQKLGYDAGFGPHTYAEHVASFVLDEIVKREMIDKEPLRLCVQQ